MPQDLMGNGEGFLNSAWSRNLKKLPLAHATLLSFPSCSWDTKSLGQEKAYSGIRCTLLHPDANLHTLWYKPPVPTYGSK